MDDKNCVTFVWKICNLEVGVCTDGDLFFSPSYHVSSLRGSAWVFWLHTSSFDDLSKEIQIGLQNQYYDRPNSNEFLIHFELSILAVNPSLTFTYTYQNIKIREGSEHKITGLPAWETLLRNRNEYLPEDVMTIQCRLWKVNTRYKDLEPLFYKGLTHTGYQKCSLTWSINFSDFEKCGTTRCKKFDLGESEPVFNLSTCSDFKREALGFNIQQLSGDFPFLHLFFKISVLDASSGNVILSKQSSCQLKPLEVLKLDPFIAFSFLKFNRKHIMKGNTLDLACEFVYNNEDDHVFMESVSNIPPMCIKKPAGSIQIEKVIEPPKKIAPTSKGLKEDLYDLYLSNSCCDVVLVAGICTFPCHKCVLFARSPVFRSILSESTTNYKIELDSSTLASFLQFLYNDDIGKPMDFLSALNLYEAAEKFQVLSLKSVCTKYLESNLTKQNACDILILSSKHQDSKLKEFVENFILKYPLDIFRTERWKNLMKSDAKHVVETMCKVYLKKGKLNLRTTAFDDYYENNFYGSLENLKFRLLELLKTSEYSDLKLHVKGRSFAVHKNILWARSPLFERLIESNSECSSNLETLISNLFSGVEIRTVEQILNFIYYGELMDEYYSEVSYEEEQSLAYKQLIEIYCTACRCQILSLRKSCSKTLARELNRDNVSEILQLAELHGDEKLKEDIYNFIFRCKHVTSWDTWKSFEKKNADLAKRTMVKVSLIRHWKKKSESPPLCNIHPHIIGAHRPLYEKGDREVHFSEECVVLHPKENFKASFHYLYKMKFMADVKLRANNRTFEVHKNILCARSPVFKAMFSCNMREATTNTIDITDIDDATLHHLLCYIYCAAVDCRLSAEDFCELYYAAEKYQVHCLKDWCSEELRDLITFENVGEILVLANRHDDHLLLMTVWNSIDIWAEEVIASKSWKTLIENEPLIACQTMLSIFF